MLVLVLSDSHRILSFMEQCVQRVQPDCIIHLGDYYPDGAELRAMCPGAEVYQVPGNCDEYGCDSSLPKILEPTIGGVRFYMTHGHLHHVKQTLFSLLRDARNAGAQIALYGHTHIPDCHQEEDGLWVLNPGAGGFLGSAGLVEIENGKILSCRLIRQRDWEAEK